MKRASGGAVGEAGFTLVEVLISLGLFGLIAVAGLALVSGVINVQGRTDVHLERLQQYQRAMLVIDSDLDQVSAGAIAGGAAELSFTRVGPAAGGAPVPVRYGLAGNALVRFLGPRPQVLLPGVTAARWRFFDGGWTDRWPRDDNHKADWPRAIEVELTVETAGGRPGGLRRLVLLPVQAVKPEPSGAPVPAGPVAPGPITS